MCLYSRNFTKKFECLNVDLITPFFSAIFTFSHATVSRNLEVLEMNDLRFVFKVSDGFIFVLLADLSTSLRFLSASLVKIAEIFLNYYENLGNNKDFEIIRNEKLDKSIDLLVLGFEKESLEYYDKFDKIFRYFVLNNEILGAAVLSTSGQVMYSSLSRDILLKELNELELRFITAVKDYSVRIKILNNEQKVVSEMISIQQGNLDYVIILLFGSSVSLGTVEQSLKKITTRIKSSL